MTAKSGSQSGSAVAVDEVDWAAELANNAIRRAHGSGGGSPKSSPFREDPAIGSKM